MRQVRQLQLVPFGVGLEPAAAGAARITSEGVFITACAESAGPPAVFRVLPPSVSDDTTPAVPSYEAGTSEDGKDVAARLNPFWWAMQAEKAEDGAACLSVEVVRYRAPLSATPVRSVGTKGASAVAGPGARKAARLTNVELQVPVLTNTVAVAEAQCLHTAVA